MVFGSGFTRVATREQHTNHTTRHWKYQRPMPHQAEHACNRQTQQSVTARKNNVHTHGRRFVVSAKCASPRHPCLMMRGFSSFPSQIRRSWYELRSHRVGKTFSAQDSLEVKVSFLIVEPLSYCTISKRYAKIRISRLSHLCRMGYDVYRILNRSSREIATAVLYRSYRRLRAHWRDRQVTRE